MSRWDVAPGTSLEVLLAEWRGAMVTSVDRETIDKMYRPHSAHIAAFFKDKPMAITKATIVDYSRAALGRVHRRSVQKELSTLRGFLTWCVERELLDVAPVVPALPRKAQGTRAKPARVNTLLTPDEARGTIAFLPEWATSKRTGSSFPVRSRFELAFETALRPATISRLAAGKHYVKGWDELKLSADIMKSRRDSVLPLNDRARAALDRVCPVEGLIYGRHDYRDALDLAARKAVERGILAAEKARTLSPYDLRHSRATECAENSTNLSAIQGLLDHTDLKSTMRYVHPTVKAVRQLLKEVSGAPTRKSGGLVGVKIVNEVPAVRRSRFELERPYRTPEPEAEVFLALRGRAKELLKCAAGDIPVAHHLLTDFARDCLRLTKVGRLALGVIDGGLHAPLRALELAQLMAELSDNATQEEIESL